MVVMETRALMLLLLSLILIKGAYSSSRNGIQCHVACQAADDSSLCDSDQYEYSTCTYRTNANTEACKKVRIGRDTFTLTCAENCQEGCDSNGCTECCYTDYCFDRDGRNGTASLVVTWVAMGVTLLASIFVSTY
ncbi:uncharacterized protein LOC121422123 [Lytechinus variegatus]|uniref:uncharacterized protein LOC121422085 n=1 Tax=Lytechinus variegatus TaxID=7654 RepID=UPI001BB2135A|nr:uncharacterized protein LOC121422085 [Lytechinus variegatus]XP_041472895.1 uncharacterized protein LOC121422123 [Lytechinus variegatus]